MEGGWWRAEGVQSEAAAVRGELGDLRGTPRRWHLHQLGLLVPIAAHRGQSETLASAPSAHCVVSVLYTTHNQTTAQVFPVYIREIIIDASEPLSPLARSVSHYWATRRVDF